MGKHLNSQQRYEISFRLQNKERKIDIARALGVHRSTISREVARNKSHRGKYDAEKAQKLSEKRMSARNHYTVLTEEIKYYVDFCLTQYQWSPEQISGRRRVLGQTPISHETIYRYVWDEKHKWGKPLYMHLRHRGRCHNRRGSSYKSRGIPGRVGIEERPPVVDEKKRFGDLEIDTIVGKNRRNVIMTINDRESGFLLLRKLPTKEAEPLAQAAIAALKPVRNELHTITADNGTEFSSHQQIARKLKVDVFFARPYHSWERGANENANGLVRQYFLKGSDFNALTDKDINMVQRKINNRPRKRLGFLTPIEFLIRKYGDNKTIQHLLRY